MTFEELGLEPNTLKAIVEMGYTDPTPIQEQAIGLIQMGRDVMGIAQTGTGKTASYTLPMIDILSNGRARARMPRSLILAPTRELAAQVSENFEQYGKYHKLSMALLIGGESFGDQERALDRGVDVLIATPGRMMDLFERGRILLSDVKILVIDEADRMLDMGFIPDVEKILGWLPPLRQTLLFSATMAPEIKRLADKFLSNPKTVSVAPPASPAELVTQAMVVVEAHAKREALRALIQNEAVANAFIFCNRKRDVAVLYRSLERHALPAGQLHGDMPQSARTETLDAFRRGDIKLLVCSDVAARGLDIADVSHVFNFDVPSHAEDYVHRIGRTGRAGREGRALTIATPEDARYVAAIQKLIGKEIPQVTLDGAAPLPLAEREGGRGGRRGGKGRPAKAEPREKTERQERTVEPREKTERRERTVEPREKTAEPREKAAPKPRAERPEAAERAAAKRPARRGRAPQPADEVEEMPHGDDVLAFGGHTPSFLLRDPFAK
ncbi:DEAD/DEAH box helicase [Oleispirillum naphthae]|uniref:DEAD/DEAH box helicase n=1 Tax=Oleispirillum naphthae TaxID=2838853 RepID=UPI0030825C82